MNATAPITQARRIERLVVGQGTRDGAGVKLTRVLTQDLQRRLDPFLMLDAFGSDQAGDYIAGFPDHPHRGFETVTYMLAGHIRHGDSQGNHGVLEAGDVQWMTAGSGIMHQEMPHGDAQGRMHGFQLWANLPSQLKMTTPRYQDVKSKDIAEETDDDGTKVRVIIGEFWGKRGPVEGIAANPCYLDVSVPPGKKKRLTIDTRANAFAYVFEGEGTFRDASEPGGVLTERHVDDDNPVRTTAGNRSLVQFGGGDEVVVQAGEQEPHPLLVSGRPIEEPVAWYGPIVMNTSEELRQAIAELRSGTFIKG